MPPRRAGIEPSYGKPTLMQVYPDLFLWMINHEYDVSALNADDITAATLRSRAELHTLIEGRPRQARPELVEGRRLYR
ncbi:MAG TPA: hypothetical protein DCX07_01730 [Phycisphaerales bacterium]|nr:hypothetical protein [Phycisphaerales bacterium]